MRLGGPPRILSSGFIAWTFPPRRVHECSRSKLCLVQLHTKTGMFWGGIVGIRSPKCRSDAVRVPSKGNVSGYDCNPCSPRRERDTASLCHTSPCLGAACFIAKADSVVCRRPFVASEYAVTCYVMTQHQSGLG